MTKNNNVTDSEESDDRKRKNDRVDSAIGLRRKILYGNIHIKE